MEKLRLMIYHTVFYGALIGTVRLAHAFEIRESDLHCKKDHDCVLLTKDCLGLDQTAVARKSVKKYLKMAAEECQSNTRPHPSILPPSPTPMCEEKSCRADFVLTNSSDFQRFDGHNVVLVGTYKSMSRPVKGKPVQTPGDYAVIELTGGTQVFLESLDSPAARRTEEERKRWEQKKVRLRGRLHKLMPSQAEGLLAPSLSEIENISAAP